MNMDIAALNLFDTNSGNLEQLQQSLYDTALYATAGFTELAFFSTPVGQGLSAQPGNANKVKTKQDTNMQTAGRLPSNAAFLAESIEVYFLPGSVSTANTFTLQSPVVWNATAAASLTAGVDDVAAFYNAGSLEFVIGEKPVLYEAPLGRFPPKTYRELRGMMASNSATTAEGVIATSYAAGRQYYFTKPLPVRENVAFAVTARWPVAVATPSGFNGQMKVVLDGQYFRKV
jgi:hypothetical protein